MQETPDMRFIRIIRMMCSSLPRMLSLCIACLLGVACSKSSVQPVDDSTATDVIVVATPRGVAQLRAIDPDNLTVQVMVNGEPQTTTREGEVETVAASIAQGEQLSIEVAWFEQFEGVNLQLAYQLRVFSQVQDGETITLDAEDYETSQFDNDGDTFSNLSERVNGTDPLDSLSPGGGGPVLAPPTLNVLATKLFRFSWTDDASTTHYRVLENIDGGSGFEQVSDDISEGVERYDYIVPLYERFDAQYVLEYCAQEACEQSASIGVPGNLTAGIGYFKASNPDSADFFGNSVALSEDGTTMAVGAPCESSSAIGVGGDQADDSAGCAGAVYVFTRTDNTWSQQAYIKARNTEAGDGFGLAVSLRGDGNTLAVGASGEDSNGIGENGGQADNSSSGSGAVYVFARRDNAWSQEDYIKASNVDSDDGFGLVVSLSGDGTKLAVGARGESSAASGINASQSDNSAASSGAVYVYSRIGSEWVHEAYIKASNTDELDQFGESISLDYDGVTLAVGATGEDSGIEGSQSDNSSSNAGAVYLYSRTTGTWTQRAYLKAGSINASGSFGAAVSLSGDGNTLASGSRLFVSQESVTFFLPNIMYVFEKNMDMWTLQESLLASNSAVADSFGSAVSLDRDGSLLAVGASGESSSAIGLSGDQNNDLASNSGAVYLFRRVDDTWAQSAYIKASNTETRDMFGTVVEISDDGNSLAVGAQGEDSRATGVNGISEDNGVDGAGAVYLY